MALCSSAHNPLTQFSKHVQDDRGLNRDKFSSRGRRKGQDFRSMNQRQSHQAGFEFNQFGSSYILPLDFAPPTQLQLVSESTILKGSESSKCSGWLSEFQNENYSSGNTGRNQLQYQPNEYKSFSQEIISRSHGYFEQPDRSIGHVQNANRFVLSRPTFSSIPQLNHTVNLAWKENDSTGTQSTCGDSHLEKLDWEIIFASLDSQTKTKSFQRLSKPEDLVDASVIEKPVKENAKVDDTQFLKTDMTDYTFQGDNPFREISNPFDEGMKIIQNDGNLSVAALAFEAACEADPSHFEAWKMLGSVFSEVEREETAIEALKEALKLDPNNLDVIMRLAISYTNEGASSSAYEHLEKWITTKYPRISVPDLESSNDLPTASQLLERIKEPFLQAARLSVTGGNDFDADVQVGLGVLLFSAREFQLAADCFSAAIQSSIPGALNTQSQLHLLWNRYGACLGNMDRYNEAIESYGMALAIRPNFVRAKYNLGLLYYNRNEPLTAAKTVLEALTAGNTADSKARAAMLKIVKIGTSHGRLEEIMQRGEPSSMYDTLRKCCGSLLKWDLMERVGPNMDLQSFQQELDKI